MAIKNLTPWAYKKGSSFLHRIQAGIKLLFLLLLSLASFFPNLVVLSCIVLVLLLLSFVAGIGPGALLRGSGPLLLVVLGVFIIQAVEISPPGIKLSGLKETIIFCVRIAAAYSIGSLLFSVTTPAEIRKSLSRLEAVLRLEKFKLSLYLSLMLGFLPRFFEIWEGLKLAWKSRGGKKNLSFLTTLIPLAVERMMSHAIETAEAMEARGA